MNDFAGLLFVTYLVTASSGIGLFVADSKKPIRVLASGFLIVTAALVSLALLFGFLGLEPWYYEASLSVPAVLLLISLKRALRQWREYLQSLGWGTLVALIGFLVVGVLNFRGAYSFDSTFVLSLAHLFQTGSPFELAQPFLKRGFAFPLLMAFAPINEFPAQLPFFMSGLLGLTFIDFARQLDRPASKNTRWIAIGVVATFLAATPMMWNLFFYIREHSLIALSLLVLTVIVFEALEAKSLSGGNFILALAASGIMATSRSEGFITALLAVGLLFAVSTRVQKFFLALVPPFTFLAWLTVIDSKLLPEKSALVFLGVLLAVAGLIFFIRLEKLWAYFGVLSAAVLLLIFSAEIAFKFDALKAGLAAQFANIVLFEGAWSVTLTIFFVLIPVAIATLDGSKRAIAVLALSTVISFFIAKTLDMWIAIGRPDLGRLGFSDSLNRMWIHEVYVLALVAVWVIDKLVAKAQQALQSRVT